MKIELSSFSARGQSSMGSAVGRNFSFRFLARYQVYLVLYVQTNGGLGLRSLLPGHHPSPYNISGLSQPSGNAGCNHLERGSLASRRRAEGSKWAGLLSPDQIDRCNSSRWSATVTRAPSPWHPFAKANDYPKAWPCPRGVIHDRTRQRWLWRR